MFEDFSREKPSVEEFNKRRSVLSEKLNSLTPEQEKSFMMELRDILESREMSSIYGARDPVNLPPSDVLEIGERLYKKNYSS